MKNYYTKLGVAVTLGMMALPYNEASATGTSGSPQAARGVADNLFEAVGTIPNLFNAAAYLGGLTFSIAGVLRLKKHIDNPSGNDDLKGALGRLGVGGTLLAFPFLLDTLAGTIGTGTTGVQFSEIENATSTFGAGGGN